MTSAKKSKFDISHYRKDPFFLRAWDEVLVIEKRNSQSTYELVFSVPYVTKPGEEIVVVGNLRELGEWNPATALKLTWSEGHVWTGSLRLTYNFGTVEYKYVCRRTIDCKWEAGANRSVSDTEGIRKGTIQTIERKDLWQA